MPRIKRDPDKYPELRSGHVWERHPRGGTLRLTLDKGAIASRSPDPDQPDVVVRGTVRDRGGALIVSLYLVTANCRPQC